MMSKCRIRENEIIIGQECICPDGLGRVEKIIYSRANTFEIQVKTYFNNRGCHWDPTNVELIDPRNVKEADEEATTLREILKKLHESVCYQLGPGDHSSPYKVNYEIFGQVKEVLSATKQQR